LVLNLPIILSEDSDVTIPENELWHHGRNKENATVYQLAASSLGLNCVIAQ
jgi:hypothetical protein